MWAIFKKEVAVYFLTPFGYVFMGLFLLITGIVFTAYNIAGARGDMLGMLGVLNFISIVVFPVLTMKLLAEEKKMATDQLLFTAAVPTTAIILGKYLAAFFVFLTALSATGIYAIFTLIFSRASLGTILASYLGFILLGSSYIAISLFASSLTENQVTAAISGFGFLFGFMLIGFLAGVVPFPMVKKVLLTLAILSKYQEFTNGLLKVGPLVYYLSFTVSFILLTIQVVENRRRSREW
ncbi:MAG TPA: ABC transporter permease [Bacillota bacterium]|nr:ABC transporter permease [Bacillota bacterium]